MLETRKRNRILNFTPFRSVRSSFCRCYAASRPRFPPSSLPSKCTFCLVPLVSAPTFTVCLQSVRLPWVVLRACPYHANTFCPYHAISFPLPCYFPAHTMLAPCPYHANTLRLSCCFLAHTMLTPCPYHANTMPPS